MRNHKANVAVVLLALVLGGGAYWLSQDRARAPVETATAERFDNAGPERSSSANGAAASELRPAADPTITGWCGAMTEMDGGDRPRPFHVPGVSKGENWFSPLLKRPLPSETPEGRRLAAIEELRKHPKETAAPVPLGRVDEETKDLIARVRDAHALRRLEAIEELGKRPKDVTASLPALIDALVDGDSSVEKRALAALEALGQKDVTRHATIDEALKREVPRIRFWFVYHFGNAPTPVQGLIQALDVPDVEIQGKAIDLLMRLGPESKPALPALRRLQKESKDSDVRLMAVQVLSGFDAQAMMPTLLTSIEDPDALVRGRAAIALARIGPAAVPGLRAVLRKEGRDVRASALGALGRIGPQARDAVPDVVPLLKSDDALLRKLADDALRKIAPDAAPTADRGK